MELPIPNKVMKLWDAWHFRGCIILSLFLQAFLVSFASRRRQSKNTLVFFLIWSAYLLADWVAAVAIGAIIKTQGDTFGPPEGENKIELLAFWASFLLLHLGGPDSITSFALEDNEFWLRHLFGLVLQGLAAAYSIYLTLPTNKLWLPTILVFVVRIFKYAERTYSLYLASLERFEASCSSDSKEAAARDSSLRLSGNNDPMMLNSTTTTAAAATTATTAATTTAGTSDHHIPQQASSEILAISNKPLKDVNEVKLMQVAYKLFESFKGLIVGKYLTFNVQILSRRTFLGADHSSAFKVIEYEILHTKVVVARRRIGYAFRFISFCFIMGAFISFIMLVDKNGVDKFDIGLSYTLLIGAIVLDFMSFIHLIFSYWTLGSLKASNWIIRCII